MAETISDMTIFFLDPKEKERDNKKTCIEDRDRRYLSV